MVKKQPNCEEEFWEYLDKIKFAKHLKKLEKKLAGKTIVIYGAGAFFQALVKKYDLSALNIIAISDRKFINHEDGHSFSGYKVCAPAEIPNLKPDYVLVSMINFIPVIEDLDETVIKNTGIKLKPLINKPFIELWQEIWS